MILKMSIITLHFTDGEQQTWDMNQTLALYKVSKAPELEVNESPGF